MANYKIEGDTIVFNEGVETSKKFAALEGDFYER